MGPTGIQNSRKQPLLWAGGQREEVVVIKPWSWGPHPLWREHYWLLLASENLRSIPLELGPRPLS